MKKPKIPSKSFTKLNKLMGLKENETTHDPSTLKGKSSLVFSGDLINSDVPPKLVLVESISKLKEIMGLSEVKSKKDFPKPNLENLMKIFDKATSKADLHQKIDSSDMDEIKSAANIYIHGDSSKVKEYEPLINAAMFPQTVAYFASDVDLVIDKPCVVKDDEGKAVVWNYDTITFKDGGSITSHVEFTINCNTMQKI